MNTALKHFPAAFAAALLSIAAGCGTPRTGPLPPSTVTLPEQFPGAGTTPNPAMIGWGEFFQDPALVDLISTALTNNQELHILQQEVAIAKAEAGARKGELFPFVKLGGRAGAEKVSRNTRDGAVEENLEIQEGRRFPEPLRNYGVIADFDWEIDIWRKLRNQRDAAMSRYLATQEGRNFMVTHLIIARLIHEIQATQNAMTEVLQRIAQPGQEPPAPTLLLGNLEESTQQLTQLSGEVRAMAGSPLWLELESTMKSFSDDIRQVLYATDPASPAQIQDLFNQNNRMISQVNELIRRSSDRLAEAELEIQDQSDKLRRNSTSLLGTSLVLAIGCAATTILFVRQSIDRLKWQSSELDRVSWHMLQGQEEAARRFSHELHDELGQSLAAVRSNLNNQGNHSLDLLRTDCLHLVDQSIANVRELSQLLRPVILDDFGLEAGLQWLAESFSQRTRLAVDFQASGIQRYCDETETHLFRIAQEAFTNIARHSGATAVVVRLTATASTIRLRIEDNGRGMPEDRPNSSSAPTLGMVGMRARARQCGGEFTVTRVEPHGHRIKVEVPVRLPPPESVS